MRVTSVPHGGRLIDRLVSTSEREAWEERAGSLPKVILNSRQLSDAGMIAAGAYSPLEGFLGEREYRSVLECERLSNGLPWTIPITLAIPEEQARAAARADAVALCDEDGHIAGVMDVTESFRYDREEEARQVLGTTSSAHPGVQYLTRCGETCLAGPIRLLRRQEDARFAGLTLDPKETRRIFAHRGWRTVAAFQTRNPIHRAHEYILKCALETVDGLLLHPLIGGTADGDIPAEVRLRCYQALLGTALPVRHTLLSVYPAAMRYAGPREAIFHALVRKNYGCTHFIVGRDHAGFAGFYGPSDAQRKFDQFTPEELGITPLRFEATFYCRQCGQVASEKTCPHQPEDRLILSGTKVRELLRRGERLPAEFTRPEVAEILESARGAGWEGRP